MEIKGWKWFRHTFFFFFWQHLEIKQEVMIDTPAASPQRLGWTKEQKTNIKPMSKAVGFCLWSCIGVISEEGPCPSTSFLSTPPNQPPPPPPARVCCHEEGKGSSLREMEGLVVGATSPGRTGLEVTAGLWPHERGSRRAKEAFLASWLSSPS